MPVDVMGIISSALKTATAAVQSALGEIQTIPVPARNGAAAASDGAVAGDWRLDTVTNTLASFMSPASGDDAQSGVSSAA